MEYQWPYNQPIFRSEFSAESPDGKLTAIVDPAYEISMGNPTIGTLVISNGITLSRCNPAFIWSEDSRFVAVPRFNKGAWRFRRQRVVIIDVVQRTAVASHERAFYFQPESFTSECLKVQQEPFSRKPKIISWDTQGMLAFRPSYLC